ncbi:sodium-dependent transporter [Campylobacter insulaenigrae]|uniref:Na+-dependent transporter, SNF family n=1 Tax=Campylobacter insulaenigrae NCTC 12927 TaxID=1031564 RepID=A0A0A8H2C2_9BACT|nr:sodium-dependent transporter [Campylobacter insulaenigrae]AJC88122.1 Na+-dependent transporter, SNF family [Campylobacter insulaenigrae NCTC 12927]VEH94921.1 sodium- and chloride-dependent transporter, SNF family [Campylobacter insulaenigrae]
MNDKFSKIGFVLAVAGGAIGLGNAWKFPTLVGQNGGFAFVLLYLVLTISVGFCVFLAEIAMGKLSHKDPVNAYKTLALKYSQKWKFAGFFMLGGIFVLSFYLVIMGWVLKYMVTSIYYLPSNTQEAGALFGNLVENSVVESSMYFLIAFVLTLFIVSKGVKSGIEKLNVWIMPSLFIMLILMLGYCFFQDGFSQAFSYLFYPDFSKLNLNSILTALGLAFFTLCLGIGCITTYAASLKDDTNVITSSLVIVLLNICIGLMMGLIVFTFIFKFNANPAEGAGLVFISLTTLFSNLENYFGNFLAFYFFLALFFAGITSAVSMIEPFTFYLINEYKISRVKALVFIGFIVFILGISCILSFSGAYKEYFSFFGLSFFDILDKLTSNFMLPLGALASAIFVGFFMSKEKIYQLFSQFMGNKTFEIWYFLLRFVAPLAIIIIMLNQIL